MTIAARAGSCPTRSAIAGIVVSGESQAETTSTIACALAAGYREIVCVGEIDEALALRAPGVVLGGERHGVAIHGFDLGNSPAEYAVPLGEVVVLTTTNGTRAILTAAAEAPVV